MKPGSPVRTYGWSTFLDHLKEACKQTFTPLPGLHRYVFALAWLFGFLFLEFICQKLQQDMVAERAKYSFMTDTGKFVLGVTLSAFFCYIGGTCFQRKNDTLRAHCNEEKQITDVKRMESFEETQPVTVLLANNQNSKGEVVSTAGGPVPCDNNLKLSQVHAKRLASVVHKKEAIRLAIKDGEQHKAERLLNEIVKSGFVPDLRSFNLVINGCVKQGDIARAESWFMDMRNAGVTPNSTSYNIIMDACGKAGNAKAAEGWFIQMIDDGQTPDEVSYATMIHAYAKYGATQQAEQWLQKMISAGLKPNVITYNSLILTCSRNGDIEGAERWAYEAEKADLSAVFVSHSAAVDDSAKYGDECHAEKRRSCKAEPNVVTYSAMIDACAKAGDRVRAEFWHRRMLARGLQPNAHTFSSVISACAKAGDAVAASQHLMNMEEAQVQADVVVYSSVLNACAKAGDTHRAKKVFQQMQSLGIQPNIIAYSSLAQSLAYRGDWIEVENLKTLMIIEGHSMNDRFLCALLLSYALACPRQAQRAEAAFADACAKGVLLNKHIFAALRRAVGKARCKQLVSAQYTATSGFQNTAESSPSRGEGALAPKGGQQLQQQHHHHQSATRGVASLAAAATSSSGGDGGGCGSGGGSGGMKPDT